MTDEPATSPKVAVGVIARPHGVYGAVRVILYWEESDALCKGRRVYLRLPSSTDGKKGPSPAASSRAGGNTETDHFPAEPGQNLDSDSKTSSATSSESDCYRVQRVSVPCQGSVVMVLEGVDTRDRAEALKGAQVLVEREDLEPPGEDEYFYYDLPGLKVIREDGTEIGRITDVFGTAASDIITVQTLGGAEILLAMTEDLVTSLDIAGGKLVVYEVSGMTDDQTISGGEAGAVGEKEEGRANGGDRDGEVGREGLEKEFSEEPDD